jgi:hypothetical protein
MQTCPRCRFKYASETHSLTPVTPNLFKIFILFSSMVVLKYNLNFFLSFFPFLKQLRSFLTPNAWAQARGHSDIEVHESVRTAKVDHSRI